AIDKIPSVLAEANWPGSSLEGAQIGAQSGKARSAKKDETAESLNRGSRTFGSIPHDLMRLNCATGKSSSVRKRRAWQSRQRREDGCSRSSAWASRHLCYGLRFSN